MKTYAVVYILAGLIAMALTPLVAAMARRLRLVDLPGVRKVHVSATPRLGGVSIFLALLGGLLPVLLLDNVVGQALRSIRPQFMCVLAGGTLMFLTGLVDDLRGLRARHKLLAQLAACAIVCVGGVRIEGFVIDGLARISFGYWSYPLTAIWIIGITNAVNLIDGLDGLAGGICGVACAVIAFFAAQTNQAVMAVLMLAMLGGLSGFLVFNFNPARIFMGDSGTLLVGFMLASSSVLCATKASTLVGLALPALALGVPIFDTLLSILRRLLQRRSIFSPDRSHIHHRLMDMGLRQRHAVILIYLVTLMAGGLGLFMMIVRGTAALGVFVCVAVLVGIVFRLVGTVRLREVLSALGRNRRIHVAQQQQQQECDDLQLRFRAVQTFAQWWQVVQYAAQQMGFTSLKLETANRDGSPCRMAWTRPQSQVEVPCLASVTLPIRQRRAGGQMRARIELPAEASIESAGRSISLFGRLVDEFSVAALPALACAEASAARPIPMNCQTKTSNSSVVSHDRR